MVSRCVAAAFLLLCPQALAQSHPCSTEVASACADRPGSDIGACLKDPEEHDYPTEVSSGCTDFIALNAACAEDIESFCDGNQFGNDLLLCLTKWTPLDNLSEKCQKVLSWAAPKEEEAAAGKPVTTDELGMTEEEEAEKKAWMKKRAEGRGDAIERMKQKKEDAIKEEDRVSLEEYKKTDPEGYASMIQQQAEEAKQQADFKKRERAQAAAVARAKKTAAGLDEEDGAGSPEEKAARTNGAPKKSSKSKGSWLYTIFSFVFIGGIGAIIYVFVTGQSKSGGSNGGGRDNAKKQKKKRG